MSDLIKRKDAIHEIVEMLAAAAPSLMPKDLWCELVVERISKLSSAQKWIPCSERLPEFPCLVSDANGNMPYVPTGIVTVESKDKGTWAIDASRIDPVQTLNGRTANLFVYGNRIVAWMPLPEPYTKDGDSE